MQRIKLMTAALLLAATTSHAATVSGQVKIDGSSTVFPITEAVAEEFGKKHPEVRVTVGESGTGGGFKKFALGEIDINDASRIIKKEEEETAKKNGVDFIAIPVAHDGITVVVPKSNTFVKSLTVAQLKQMWEPDSKIKLWSDLNPAWPKQEIKRFGPGTASGTFDYFTEAINGKAGASIKDFSKSEDDNTLVAGVAGNPYAIGYFGYAYYATHTAKLTALPIDSGKGPVAPTEKTINDESYAPLSRIVYIYVSKKAAVRPEVKEFVNFYIDQAPTLVKDVKYVPLAPAKYAAAKKAFGALK